jgi:site-specific DNA-adenine methylase
MGSKDKICDYIISLFPKADHFYDLFGGGFAVTHAMLLKRSKDYKYFHFNEIRPGICELLKNAIDGKYNYNNFKPKFVSRDEFFKSLDKDPYIKLCWSFGNNGEDYLFSKDIELYKRSLHNAIIFNDFDKTAVKILGITKFKDEYSIKDRMLFLRNRIRVIHKNKSRGELQQLNFTNLSYDNVHIEKNSVVYCDPPYIGTVQYYDAKFDHNKFYDWCDRQMVTVFISEYYMPSGRFKLLASLKKRSLFSSESRIYKIEKVYINRYAYESLYKNRKMSNG